MTAMPSDSQAARLRLTRMPPASDKPQSGPSASNVTSNSPSRGIVPSNVAMFLTNLRLLDLDLLPDWPHISSRTFVTKDSGQGQKRRTHCVEWALYRLFALWDPEETRSKLQPFFPPSDQVQSLNLRAGLLRALDQAKKNGVLGRDAVVRKTMLDEAKGDRLEEVLAVMSSAVVKRRVAEDQLCAGFAPAIAQTWALQNRSYSAEQTELNALVLAHTVSLAGLLREKEKSRAKYEDFSDLLDLKQRSISRRREHARAYPVAGPGGGPPELSPSEKETVQRAVQNNWSSSDGWAESLMHGDTAFPRDGLLATPFDRVWRRVESGRLTELEDRGATLLEQLESRVGVQRKRLRGWEDFCARWLGPPERRAAQPANASISKQRGIDLGFGAHEHLRLGRKLTSDSATPLCGDYTALVDGLRRELNRIEKGSPITAEVVFQPRPRNDTTRDQLSALVAEEEPISELSELEEEIAQPPTPSRPSGDATRQQPEPISKRSKIPDTTVIAAQETTRRLQQSAGLPGTLGRQTISTSTSHPVPVLPLPRPQMRPPPQPSAPSTVRTPSPVRQSPVHPSTPPPAHASPPPPSVSPTQQLADQILASMNSASPSPQKKARHTLSLAERTRLSMARGTRVTCFDEDDEEQDIMALSLRRAPNTMSVTSNGKPPASSTPVEEPLFGPQEDLAARTRKSMAGFEAARQKAQLERRRSQRKSRPLPASAASTSRRDGSSYFPAVDEGDSAILAEELMSGEQDNAEAIFKSRPKIKNSPATSPSKEWE